MIKFYRKIRQKLLTEYKFNKYLLYALGEIILVVIGILIALQLNTNKEINTNNEQVEKVLTSIFKDLEEDILRTIHFQINFNENKDSLSTVVLSKKVQEADYILRSNGYNPYLTLIEEQVEPFRFETNAYNRLINIIEIVPEKYLPIVEKLQDVYGDEAMITNDVVMEKKVFLEKIQDSYQNNHDWYSGTLESDYTNKVTYLLNDKQHLNDVKRYQKITEHLLQHLRILNQKASYVYNLIHRDLALTSNKSEAIDAIEFPTSEELNAFIGTYKDENTGNEIEIIQDQQNLLFKNRGIAYKVGKDTFKIMEASNVSLKFQRNTNGKVISVSFFVKEKESTSSNKSRISKLIKIK